MRQIKLRLASHLFSFRFGRVKKVVGICSLRPNSDRYHNILFDIDRTTDEIPYAISYSWSEKSPHGIHLIRLGNHSFKRCIRELVLCGACDPNHILMGIKRGYWFLQNYEQMPMDVLRQCTPMTIERNDK